MAKDRYLQAVRGAAICAVVLIHCLPQCDASVAVRPFLNWGVAAFIFLSGYLTSEEKIMRGGVLSGRLKKTLVPYVLWSVAYALLLQHSGAFGVVKALVIGGASAQMYYVLVYAQLVVLTPLLYRLLHAWPVVPYALGVLALVGREAAALAGFALPHIQAIFAVWLIFYVVGLDWERWRGYVEGKAAFWGVAVAIALCVQGGFGFTWNAYGDYNMATTQLKLSSMVTSLAVIALIMALPAHLKAKAGGSLLGKLGDASFGIFLCHMFAVAALGKVLGLAALPLTAFAALKWLLAVAASYVFCVLGGRVLPKKVAGWLGL